MSSSKSTKLVLRPYHTNLCPCAFLEFWPLDSPPPSLIIIKAVVKKSTAC